MGFPYLILGVTGNALKEDVCQLLDAGADAVISKPLRPNQIDAIFDYVRANGIQTNANYKLFFNEGVLQKIDMTGK